MDRLPYTISSMSTRPTQIHNVYPRPRFALRSLNMLGCWTIFIAPLIKVILLDDDRVGRLRGSIFALSGDGTIATISPDGLEL